MGIIPAVPQVGSLGASGDLAPLAHIAAALIGEGYVLVNGRRMPTELILRRQGITPLRLKLKEGLSLINGTSAMTGLGALVVDKALDQVLQVEIVAALVLEALRASNSPFQTSGHDIARPHRGQIRCASNMRSLLEGSKLVKRHEQLQAETAKSKSANGS